MENNTEMLTATDKFVDVLAAVFPSQFFLVEQP